MIENFSLIFPQRVHFGCGTLEKLAAETKKIGQRVLLVTSSGAMRESGVLEKIESQFGEIGLEYFIFDKVSPDPSLKIVEEGVEKGREMGVRVVVGLGGGSSIDAAKAIAASIYSSHSVNDIFYATKKTLVDDSALPIVAVPSTSGTGSELSKGAVITDTEKGVKGGGFRGEYLLPRVAIVDPELTFSMPPTLTAATGFDVFAHAMESYFSRAGNALTELFALKSIALGGKYLRRAVENGEDREARVNMSYASMIVGFNLANASTLLPHRMQYPLSIYSKKSHGLGLAMLHPAWLKCVAEKEPERMNEILKYWNDGQECDLTKVMDWMKEIGLPTSIVDTEITEEICLKMTDEVSGNFELDPCFENRETIKSIYLNSLKS